MQERKLVANRWIAPDGEILQSKYRHDCVFHQCILTQSQCMVDGGIEGYIRLSGPLRDDCVYSDDPHEKKREAFMWGSRSGWVTPAEMTAEHIQAVLDTQSHIPEYIREMFEDEIEYRNEQEC